MLKMYYLKDFQDAKLILFTGHRNTCMVDIWLLMVDFVPDRLITLVNFVAFASVYCCLVVACWERADLLALVGDVYVFLLLSHVVSWVRCGT